MISKVFSSSFAYSPEGLVPGLELYHTSPECQSFIQMLVVLYKISVPEEVGMIRTLVTQMTV